MPKIQTHSNGDKYFEQLIPDPIVVILFKDKVTIVRADGHVVERELAPDTDDDYDDHPIGAELW